MSKKILLINQNAALMANRLLPLLQSSEIECVSVAPDINEIISEKNGADIFVLLSGDFVNDPEEFLLSLKDIAIASGRPFCVAAYEKEMKVIEHNVTKSVIVREFLRPLDINDLANALKAMSGGNVEKKQILLVDDDVTFLQMMQKWLGTKYQVAAARAGTQAIKYTEGHTADLILLDYEMPLMNGPKVLEIFRKNPQTANVPVIFLTGRTDRESVLNIMSLKPEGYLLKSMNKDEILDSLERFFKTKKWQNI